MELEIVLNHLALNHSKVAARDDEDELVRVERGYFFGDYSDSIALPFKSVPETRGW